MSMFFSKGESEDQKSKNDSSMFNLVKKDQEDRGLTVEQAVKESLVVEEPKRGKHEIYLETTIHPKTVVPSEVVKVLGEITKK